MSRDLFDAEIGYAVSAENGDRLALIISGTSAPDGTSGKQSEAPIGSIYMHSGNGDVYKKIANAGAAADWSALGDVTIDELNWRNEKVRFATVDTIAAGSVDVLALSDNDDLVYGDVAVGEYIIGDIDGSPALFEVTATPGTPNITVAAAGQAIASNDTFVVQQYLPDPSGQENAAIVHIPVAGSPGIKISDFDWALATGITVSGGYAASSGDPTAGDTVEVVLQKLDGNNDAQDTLLGTSQGDLNLGSFSAPGSFLLTATETVKSALQKVADYLFGVKVTQTTGVTTTTACDSIPHATYNRVQWLIEVFETGTPANREAFVMDALTDGTNVDDNLYGKLSLGSKISGLTIEAAINGANLELEVTATPSCTVNVRRLTVN